MTRRFGLFLTILLLAVAFLGFNLLTGNALRGARIDATQGRIYTLTAGSKNIAKALKEPITLSYFFSTEAARGQSSIEAYAKRVRELLEEYERASAGNVKLRVIDPVPSSEAEDDAVQSGLQGIPVGPGKSIYFGLVGTNTADGRESIPILDPSKERFLEYDISRMIAALGTTKKPVIGVISGLQVFGGYKMNRMSRQPEPTRQFQVFDELKQLYEVRKIDNATLSTIDADVNLLMLIHPKELSESAQYAIDQFVLRGGRLMVFLDPLCEADDAGDPYGVTGKDSTLTKLLGAWGVEVPEGVLATDQDIAMSVMMGTRSNPEQVPYICWLETRKEHMSPQDAVTGQVQVVRWATSGHIIESKTPPAVKPTFTPIIQTTARSQTLLVSVLGFPPDPKKLFAEFVPGATKLTLAARLFGPAATAFPEGPPKNPDGTGVADAAKQLKSNKDPVNILIFADADVITDNLWMRAQDFLGQRLVQKMADNGDMVVAAADNLCGSNDLIQVRARQEAARPFVKVEEMQKNASQLYQKEEQQLQNKIQQTEQSIAELSKARGADQSGGLVLSAEQQAQITTLRAEMVASRKELRKVQLNYRRSVEALGTKLRFLNAALMPLALVGAALVLWMVRARK